MNGLGGPSASARTGRASWGLLPLIALFGCPAGEGECTTTEDCHSAGLSASSCVGGTCVNACLSDADCGAANLICESLRCVDACPAGCDASEPVCSRSRCAIYAEGFEPDTPLAIVSLETLGWNDLPRARRNTKPKVVKQDNARCAATQLDEHCAGTAADGTHYLVLGRQPTSALPGFVSGQTCKACRCCLDCRSAKTRTATSGCGVAYPAEANQCSATPPDACAGVCAECDRCPAVPPTTEFGEGLDACELQAAGRACSHCLEAAACLQTGTPETCMDPSDRCSLCDRADQLRRERPQEPSLWRELVRACEAQGGGGCTTTIVAYEPQLTESEQSIESPAIDLSAATGDVVLELQYVPFNVGETYFKVDQTKPREEWPRVPQDVIVELCGGNCLEAASWRPGVYRGGGAATFPSPRERDNGLVYANQARADWRNSLREVEIPADLRTREFRFRFVPSLDDGARIGLDAVTIRRVR